MTTITLYKDEVYLFEDGKLIASHNLYNEAKVVTQLERWDKIYSFTEPLIDVIDTVLDYMVSFFSEE